LIERARRAITKYTTVLALSPEVTPQDAVKVAMAAGEEQALTRASPRFRNDEPGGLLLYKPSLPTGMKVHASLLALLFMALPVFAGKGDKAHEPSPIARARQNTIEARALIARIDEGAKAKASQKLAGKLTAIESDLESVRKSRGTALPHAKKTIDELKEAAAAADGNPAKLKEVDAKLEELLQQINKAMAQLK
jgi:hypothetical protein